MYGIQYGSRSRDMSLARIALKPPICCAVKLLIIHRAGRGFPDSRFSCDGVHSYSGMTEVNSGAGSC